jgi:hypothetical protein
MQQANSDMEIIKLFKFAPFTQTIFSQKVPPQSILSPEVRVKIDSQHPLHIVKDD